MGNFADKLKYELQEKGVRFWANDNIAEHLAPGDKEVLIKEATEAFEKVLDCLVIDRKTDPNSIDTGRRMAKMYINEIMSGQCS